MEFNLSKKGEEVIILGGSGFGDLYGKGSESESMNALSEGFKNNIRSLLFLLLFSSFIYLQFFFLSNPTLFLSSLSFLSLSLSLIIRIIDTAPHYGLGVSEERIGSFTFKSYMQVYTKVGRIILDKNNEEDAALLKGKYMNAGMM